MKQATRFEEHAMLQNLISSRKQDRKQSSFEGYYVALVHVRGLKFFLYLPNRQIKLRPSSETLDRAVLFLGHNPQLFLSCPVATKAICFENEPDPTGKGK